MRRSAAALCVRALAGSVTAAIALLCAPGARPAAEPDAGSVIRRGIRELLERPALRLDGRALDPRALGRFYRARDFAPAWEANRGGLERVSLLLQTLATADAHGLDPERYHLSAIRTRQMRPGGRSTIETIETAFAAPDGVVQFRDDVYGRDRRLAAMLVAEPGAPGPAPSGGIGGCPSPGKETGG